MNRFQRVLLILLCVLILPLQPAYAAGNGNVDGGGGNLNQGITGYNWPDVGYDGVRVTAVDTETGLRASVPIDITNKNITAIAPNIAHFGKVSKLDYRNGAALTLQLGNYEYETPQTLIPQIISGNSKKASIEQIRQYFCSEAATMMVADRIGIPYEDIAEGKYKLVIEPVIYLIYQHVFFAMTTTEAGLYNRILAGDLGSHFPTVVMKNHALALFLQRDDLGFAAWTGPTTSARTTEQMIGILGIGIISYQSAPPTETTFDRQYRTDTEVILSVTLTASRNKTPDSPAYARFTVDGTTYTHNNIYIPEDGSQLAWVKWRTPSEPGTVTITIRSNCSVSNTTITAEILDLDVNPPPDPQANDRNDGFSIPSVPVRQNVEELVWGEWDCWWEEYWVYHDGGDDDDGYWCDHGWWEYEWIPYSASLTADFCTNPDEKSPTASGNTMKSGYGLNASVMAQVRSDAPSSQFTGVQNVVTYFPEFQYATYWRLLKRLNTGLSSSFEFQQNKYSTYGQSVHFTPIWYPDGRYTTYAECLDAWTPAGMLQVNLNSDITLRGSLFDDWHIRPVK